MIENVILQGRLLWEDNISHEVLQLFVCISGSSQVLCTSGGNGPCLTFLCIPREENPEGWGVLAQAWLK